MFVIATKEFIEMMKSFKALLVIALLVLSSYFASSFIASAPAEFMMGTDAYTAVIRLFLLGFGFVFVLMLSHDVMSREVAAGTMRLLITKTSRIAIIGGKFLGIAAFWLFSLGVSLAIISFFAKELPWLAFFTVVQFFTIHYRTLLTPFDISEIAKCLFTHRARCKLYRTDHRHLEYIFR